MPKNIDIDPNKIFAKDGKILSEAKKIEKEKNINLKKTKLDKEVK